ncbi:6-phosphogluconolactonase [Jeotgalibacillus proteolyticus]|uniref:6-phosphogluconolactonase n=1 Tax=Jeotgalibacillus proteolyticus TaxID=2082395 RepID=A0A2S5GCH1_9BACL|nr:lactonase family protein [Jeotgalibacillus proteolyticus]PPA70689.1 6-phosphogluconolactonase [Jeotgalibacillus proteolyticus]
MDKTSYTGYIGTYTDGDSKGIYTFALDVEKGELTKAEVAAELPSPTYVSVSSNQEYLYAVSPGGLTSYKIDASSGKLTVMNESAEREGTPCYVAINAENQFAAAANYHDGTVVLYKADEETGKLTEQLSVAEQEGGGPHERQDAPHMHYSEFTPDGKYLIGVDLGTDEVVTYEYKKGELKDVQRLKTSEGAGPRHLAFHPNGVNAFVMTELSNEVLALAYNQEDGSFEIIQTIKAIPEDFKENSQGSAIHVSSDGRFVYAGNRGHDSIAVFEIEQNSYKLELVEYAPSGGNWPRDFVLDPTEKFLITTNQESSNAVLYKRDPETGKLTETGSSISVPDPVCVKFLR